MSVRFTSMVQQPRQRVRDALYARTWELAPYMDEIETAVLVEEVRTRAGRQRATHNWRAKANVPAMLAPHMDSSYFAWTASVEWSGKDFSSHWRIEPHAVKDRIFCTAEVTLAEALGGRATRVAIELSIEGLDGRAGIKTIANQIVAVNWRKLVEAAGRSLQ